MIKNRRKKIKKIFAALAIGAILIGCGKKEAPATTSNVEEDNKIVIGVSPVPHAEIINALEDEFKKAGLEVETVVFDDYVQPNLQLASGDIDANYFQHKPYFDEFISSHNLDLTSLGTVHIEPLGVYSTKISSLDELNDGDDVIIPNDPSNAARALILLDENGVIKLKDKTNLKSTEADIVENPKNLHFTAIDAQNIPNVYKDAAIGIINSNYAIGAGINPKNDSIVIESSESPYANLVAVRTEDKDKPKFKKLMEVLQSDATKNFLEIEYKGSIFPAFE